MIKLRVSTITLFVFLLPLFLAQPSSAQFGKLKDKIKKEAEKKTVTEKKEEAPKTEGDETPKADSAQEPTTTATTASDDFQLFTKFDFVPGQKVLYYDDLAGEELGEFPSRWGLTSGVFEIAKVGTQNWIMVSARGQIYPKLNVTQLPERYTVEFDILGRTSGYTGTHFIDFLCVGADGNNDAYLRVHNDDIAYFGMSDDEGYMRDVSNKPVPRGFSSGVHHIRIMVTKSSMKCYVDNERVVNAPRTLGFTPSKFALAFHADDFDFEREKMFFGNFCFAEGGKTMREQLDESGKVVTHGIYFDVNSAKIRPESYKTLAEINDMLAADPSLKLMIAGHTDADGDDASNMTLSQKRAESVGAYLVETYKIEKSRLEAKGFGESKPIDANTTPEGKANNRRVELAKL